MQSEMKGKECERAHQSQPGLVNKGRMNLGQDLNTEKADLEQQSAEEAP